MNRRSVCGTLTLVALATALPVMAQSDSPVRIAWVSTDRPRTDSPALNAFRLGLREFGYVEGRNLVIDTWWGEGSAQRLTAMAGDILRSNPDFIVAQGGLALGPMLKAGARPPILYSISADPVQYGVAASYGRPGGNATGLSLFALELVGKRMELLKQVMPGLKRVAVVANPNHAGEFLERDAAQSAADTQSLALRYFPVRSAAELDAALAAVAKGGDQAIVAFADSFTTGFAKRFAKFTLEHRIPAISGWAEFARDGNLMTYGPVVSDNYRRLAGYVDRIRKGAKAGDLPIELPTKIELVINAKTAKAIGLTIPSSVLARADEVIR